MMLCNSARSRLKLLTAVLLLSVITLIIPAGCGSTGIEPDYFTIIALPDTQFYSSNYPDIFEAQISWIKNNVESQNIVFTIHLGDIVDQSKSDRQWINARNAMSELDGLQYSVLPGNHDISESQNSLNYDQFNKYFPYSGFVNYQWYGGHYPENGNQNNYETFTALGIRILVINIGYFAEYNSKKTIPESFDSTVSWAQQVLDNNRSSYVILATHAFLGNNGKKISEGKVLWDRLVSRCNNIHLVLCGHINGEAVNADTRAADNTRVYEILSDYQNLDHGGSGYLRIYKFYPGRNIIQVDTYSPWLNRYRNTSTPFQIPFDLPPASNNTSN